MSAVIRVKRRIDEEPLDAFVLNCKKRRLDDINGETSTSSLAPANDKDANRTNFLENANETSTILKFAGTVANEDDISSHITRLTKSDAIAATQKSRKPNPTSKSRQQTRLDSQENRFKVVNCYRTIENDGETSGASNFTVVDIVKQENGIDDEKAGEKNTPDQPPFIENNLDAPSTSVNQQQSTDNYVFDLYLPDQDNQIEFDGNIVDDLISIRPFQNLLYQTNDDAYQDSDNSEDSNAENNFRNDYPDTDEDFSVGEEDMRKAIEEINFGSDNDRELSSDESDYGREPAIHFLEADEDDDIADYRYLKRNGHSKVRLRYSRNTTGSTRMQYNDDSDDDEGDNNSDNIQNSDSDIKSDDE